MISGVLEIEIMNSIWNLQDQDEDTNISVADVVENLSNNNTERAYTTIKTVMDRLVAKELMVRYKNGNKFFYRSTFVREEVIRETIKDVSEQFFGGNYVQMMRFVERECEHLLA